MSNGEAQVLLDRFSKSFGEYETQADCPCGASIAWKRPSQEVYDWALKHASHLPPTMRPAAKRERRAVKIWADGEPEPVSPKMHNTDAPPHWFYETPTYAAELYGLEKGTKGGGPTKYTIHVWDDLGMPHEFTVIVGHELTATVSQRYEPPANTPYGVAPRSGR
jgi:hypothetical protein